MHEFEIYYSYIDLETGIRIETHETYEAWDAQEAVDSCREDFYPWDGMQVTDVYERTDCGWELTECWM